MKDYEETAKFSARIKEHSLRMVHHAKASHIGSCFSMAEIIAVLYTRVLGISPATVSEPDRHRLIVSKGHAAAIVYAALAEVGLIDHDELNTYCDDGSRLSGHVTHHHIPGIEVSTGSLGHGLSLGIGFAMSARHSKSDSQTYVVLSDGECDEGSIWEGILFAPHQQLSNLTVIVDFNKIQSFGRVAEVLDLEPFLGKWEACNWHCLSVDGHNIEELDRAFVSATAETERPSVIIANTVKGHGVDFMEDNLAWHYKSPNNDELLEAIRQVMQ